MAKGVVESINEAIEIYYRLSEESKKYIVYDRILECIEQGFSPEEIMELLRSREERNILHAED